VTSVSGLRDLLQQILLASDATTLYNICQHALVLTGARNAMISDYSVEHGAMLLRAGVGRDWSPGMLGDKINVAKQAEEGITAYVAATGKSYRSDDVSQDVHYKALIPGTRSELASPIRDKYARIRGAINVESDEPAKFGEDQEFALELLAAIAGIALDREDARAREEAISQVVTALEQAHSEQDLLGKVSLVARNVLRASAYSIFLWSEDAEGFVLIDTGGTSTLDKGAQYTPGEGCTGWVCQHGEPIRLHKPFDDPRWRGKFLEFPIDEIQSFVAAPVLSGHRCLGCIRALRKVPSNQYIDNRFTDDDERLLMLIAEHLGMGIERLRNVKRILKSERMAAWGELSAKSSHIIGNRVFALKGDINELRYLLNEPELARQSILDIVQNLEGAVGRLDDVLHEFRDFVTATQVTKAPGDLNSVVKKAAEGLLPVSSPVRLRLELDPGLPKFAFDADKMERSVSELVENALHFVEKGEISVRTRTAGIDDIVKARITARAGEYALIEIEDKGPGVAGNSKARIFQPYTSTRPRGMGLGLSIVKGIVEAHGGMVYEAGEEGKGAKFVILLPIGAEG
jgi:signal transduction histidine kinase/putative methionine-R-sulfoxide reductase with GAF domain